MKRSPLRRLLLLGTVGLLLLAAAFVARREVARLTAVVLGAPPRVPERPLVRAEQPLAEACRAASVAYPPPEPHVVIHKAERVFALYSGETLIKEYSVGLGGDPLPDKEREGDRRTPTGDFYVCTRLEKSRWHRFLGISYPAPEDAERGLEQGAISRAEYDAILAAHRRRSVPLWNTALGGEIGIHGGGSGIDWTFGCIALENDAVTELFPVLPLGTPVRIE
jgi:lipoprotein-anchoring transpeptidase ErfK/SrfK